MYLTIDIGGTKTLVAIFDDSGSIQSSVKFPTPASYGEFIDKLSKTIESLPTTELVGACVAIPGLVDREKGMIIGLGNLPWKHALIRDDLRQIVNCPVVIENDANLAGLSEANLIKDQYRKVLYVTISTGIGGGYVVDGILDPNTIDAEIGHMIFEGEGGIKAWEDIASGEWIVKTYGKKASDLDDQAAWKTISHNIALGLINASAALTPDVIVIGGGVGSHLDKFDRLLKESIDQLKPEILNVPSILQAQRPEEAVIYGCYELARQQNK